MRAGYQTGAALPQCTKGRETVDLTPAYGWSRREVRGREPNRWGRAMTVTNRTRWVILRDLLIFQVKLVLDGGKDIVLAPVSLLAVALDLFFPGGRPGHRFYAVMRVGERFDRWLSLFSAADKATALEDGLFGASRAGSRSLLGQLEAIVLGHEEPVVDGR
jgi:hypothetical protein